MSRSDKNASTTRLPSQERATPPSRVCLGFQPACGGYSFRLLADKLCRGQGAEQRTALAAHRRLPAPHLATCIPGVAWPSTTYLAHMVLAATRILRASWLFPSGSCSVKALGSRFSTWTMASGPFVATRKPALSLPRASRRVG